MITIKHIIFAGLALLALYLGGYAHARMTHKIVHMQNGSVGPHQVIAKSDSWDDLQIEMTKEIPLVGTFERVQNNTGLLNVGFWPLRKIEAAYWNWNNE